MARYVGTNGADFLQGNGADDDIVGLRGNDVLVGNGGSDYISGGSENDTLYGGSSGDALSGDDGHDRLFGESGEDFLSGGNGDDRLFGGSNNDTLIGGLGDDYVDGGLGSDLLTGGAGNDIFDYDSVDESPVGNGFRDIIADFNGNGNAPGDTINLFNIDAIVGAPGNHTFDYIGGALFSGTAGELRYDGQILRGDTDGDFSSDFHIDLNGASLVESDIVL